MLTDRGTLIFALRDSEGLIEVIDDQDSRSLYFGTRARQSCMSLGDPYSLQLGYTRAMLAALLFQPDPQRVLMIGLGGGSLARFLLHRLPNVRIDCVETREAVVTVARRYFQLPEDERLQIHIDCGVEFIRQRGHRYDLILVDAFDSGGVDPGVCTERFFADCRRILRPEGVLSINLWATPQSPFKTILHDMERGFESQILRLPVEKRANLVALGLDRALTRTELKAMQRVARTLDGKLQLDLPKLLRRLIHYNSALMRRYLDLRSA